MKNKPLFAIIALVVIATIGVAFYIISNSSSSHSMSCTSLSRKPIIVAFGDSLISGYGAPDQHGFIDPLSEKLGVPLINEGESGDTTADALTRIPAVLGHHPDIVIVLLGGNDALQHVPIDTTKANLTQILSAIKGSGAQIVLVGIQGGYLSDPFASMFSDLAKTYAAAYVPSILSGLIGNQTYMYDEVHPNAIGYTKVSEKIYPDVLQACGALSSTAK
jgi:acyl-CoA thioesterase-1